MPARCGAGGGGAAAGEVEEGRREAGGGEVAEGVLEGGDLGLGLGGGEIGGGGEVGHQAFEPEVAGVADGVEDQR